MKFRLSWLFLFFLSFLLCQSSVHFAVKRDRTIASGDSFSKDQFQTEILKRMSRIEELNTLIEEAKKLKKKVYLSGGTATTFANYVWWDLDRETGNSKYVSEKFDYNVFNVFMSNQDFDIAIDGSNADAEKLSKIMEEKAPLYQGDHSAWEIIPLRHDKGFKERWLDNPNRLKQHSDSMSNGLIEITGLDEYPFRDALAFETREVSFITDLFERKIHFLYRGEEHFLTERGARGDNPEIFSVIRFINKMMSLDLETDAESEKNIKKIVSKFSFSDVKQGYPSKWFSIQLKKMVANTENLEKLWSFLDNVGLLQKLKEIGDPEDVKSIANLFSKKPLLKAKPKAQKSKTAKELGLSLLAHDTDSLESWESISKSSTGEANFFISNKNQKGELAIYGDGVYFSVGEKGRWNNGYTVKVLLAPDAVEGVDFKVVGSGVLVLNKAKIKIKQEAIVPINPEDVLHNLIRRGEINAIEQRLLQKNRDFWTREKLEKLLLRVSEEEAYADKFFMFYNPRFLGKEVIQNPDLVEKLIEGGRFDRQLLISVLSTAEWSDHPKLILKLMENKENLVFIVSSIFKNHVWSKQPQLVEEVIKRGLLPKSIMEEVMALPHYRRHPYFRPMNGYQDQFITYDDIYSYLKKNGKLKVAPSEGVNCMSAVSGFLSAI